MTFVRCHYLMPLRVDQLAGELKEAQRLVAFCREKLYATDEEIKKILETGEKEA